MFIRRFFILLLIIPLFTGCATRQPDWNAQYGTPPAGNPGDIQTAVYNPEYGMYGDQYNTYAPKTGVKTVAVLLPLTGENAKLGNSISKSIQLAFLQKNYKNINVDFIDTANDVDTAIMNALAGGPDIIIGPVFSGDTQKLTSQKPIDLPVLSFSSDQSVIGGGVMTMALMPTQSTEAVVAEIKNDKTSRLLILTPKSESGEIMAAAALAAANLYDISIAGLQYYAPGDSDSIKAVAQYSSMWDPRSGANTRAREILSDALIREKLTASQKSSLNTQLDKISKVETLGPVPYDAVLLLGDASDSKTMSSFLRYYNVDAKDVKFYGTAMWDAPEILTDFSMSGAKFAGLPEMSDGFVKLYEKTYGTKPTRIDSFGFDAANLAIGMLLGDKIPAAYLLDPSGYNGTSGLLRLTPSGENQRALQIMKLNGSGAPKLSTLPATSFIKPIYQISTKDLGNAYEIELSGGGINPNDYIQLPASIAYKYTSKTYGAGIKTQQTNPEPKTEIIVLPEDDSEVIQSEIFKPTELETVDRKLIDSVEIAE